MANRTHGATGTPEYKAWRSMRERCLCPTHQAWGRYGGRGIRVEFSSFEEFYACVGPKPSPAHSLDRILNDGNYEPGNVRWATPLEQTRNRRPSSEWKQPRAKTRPYKHTKPRDPEHTRKLVESWRRTMDARKGIAL